MLRHHSLFRDDCPVYILSIIKFLPPAFWPFSVSLRISQFFKGHNSNLIIPLPNNSLARDYDWENRIFSPNWRILFEGYLCFDLISLTHLILIISNNQDLALLIISAMTTSEDNSGYVVLGSDCFVLNPSSVLRF